MPRKGKESKSIGWAHDHADVVKESTKRIKGYQGESRRGRKHFLGTERKYRMKMTAANIPRTMLRRSGM